MWKAIRSFIFELFLVLLSVGLTSLSFPTVFNYDGWGPLSFISLIPVIYVIARTGWIRSAFFGWLFGFTYYLIYNYWLSTFHPLAILIAPILESVQYLVLFPVLKLSFSLFKKRSYIVFSTIFVAYCYITQQGFLAYPYGNITASLWNYPILIQSASIFGIWGILYLQIIPQAFAAEAILRKWRLKDFRLDVFIYLALFLLNLVFGLSSYYYYENKEAKRTIRIAAVSHSADTWIGGSQTYRKNLNTLMRLTDEVMEEEPEMVVWSETAFVPSVTWHTNYPNNAFSSRMVNDFVSYGLSLGVPLVTGNPEGVLKDPDKPPYLEDGSWNVDYYNTVIYFNDGEVVDTYRKQHLVPFTEHFPYQREFPRLTALLIANDYNWWLTGYEATVFNYDGIGFSTPICFEDTFGYLSADFVRNGADMLINLSNDVWSKSVVAEMQHMQLAVFRAIENRCPLLRSTNSGITCLIEPSGDYVDPQEPFVEVYHVYSVPLYKREGLTFYTRHVDLLAKASIYYAAILILYGVLTHKKKEEEDKYLYYSSMFENMDERVEC